MKKFPVTIKEYEKTKGVHMNGRRLYREYAQSKGKDAKEFVKIEEDWYNQDTLITKDNQGNEERTIINYKDLVNWIPMVHNVHNFPFGGHYIPNQTD
jgi:hypothetical protein